MSSAPSEEQRSALAALANAINSAWRALAPTVPAKSYLDAVTAFQKVYVSSMSPPHLGNRVIGPEEAAKLPDNSAIYETVSYRYQGIDAVRTAIAERVPLMFVAWHHGAIHHVNHGIARVLPQTAIFTRWAYQFGRVVTYPMHGPGAFTLLRMDRFLREGRPVSFFIDGPAFGKVVRLSIFGLPADFALGPIHVACSVEGARIVPITHYLRAGNTVEITFHPPTPATGRLAEMSERDVIELLLTLFEQDLRLNAPEQVLPQFLVHREVIVRDESPTSGVNRQ